MLETLIAARAARCIALFFPVSHIIHHMRKARGGQDALNTGINVLYSDNLRDWGNQQESQKFTTKYYFKVCLSLSPRGGSESRHPQGRCTGGGNVYL